MVLIGRKRERVAFQTYAAPSPDTYGDAYAGSWSTAGTYWCEVEPIRGKEYFAQDRAREDVSHRFRFRWNSTLDAATGKDRLLWNSTGFDIVSIINSNARDREIEIMAREIR